MESIHVLLENSCSFARTGSDASSDRPGDGLADDRRRGAVSLGKQTFLAPLLDLPAWPAVSSQATRCE